MHKRYWDRPAPGAARPVEALSFRARFDLQLAVGRNLDIVTQVETLGPYARAVCSDYALYTAGTAMLETAERLYRLARPGGRRGVGHRGG